MRRRRRRRRRGCRELSPAAVTAPLLAGEPITARLTRAPGNDAAIGGLKVVAANGWFAARPSGTENLYKLYAESFRDERHLRAIVDEAQQIVDARARGAGRSGMTRSGSAFSVCPSRFPIAADRPGKFANHPAVIASYARAGATQALVWSEHPREAT